MNRGRLGSRRSLNRFIQATFGFPTNHWHFTQKPLEFARLRMGSWVANWVCNLLQISQCFYKAKLVCKMSLHRLFKFRIGFRKEKLVCKFFARQIWGCEIFVSWFWGCKIFASLFWGCEIFSCLCELLYFSSFRKKLKSFSIRFLIHLQLIIKN